MMVPDGDCGRVVGYASRSVRPITRPVPTQSGDLGHGAGVEAVYQATADGGGDPPSPSGQLKCLLICDPTIGGHTTAILIFWAFRQNTQSVAK